MPRFAAKPESENLVYLLLIYEYMANPKRISIPTRLPHFPRTLKLYNVTEFCEGRSSVKSKIRDSVPFGSVYITDSGFCCDIPLTSESVSQMFFKSISV